MWAGFVFPLLPGCMPVYLAGLLGGMFVGFGCLSCARCVGLLVIDLCRDVALL